MARFLVLALVLVACGKVTDPDAVDGGTHADGKGSAHPDATPKVTKPVAAVTSIGIAGTPAQCTLATPSTGGGSAIVYTASWTINGIPFTDTVTTSTTIAADTVPGTATHTGAVIACTLFATAGDDSETSDPVSVKMKPRTAFLVARSGTTGTLLSIDLDTLAAPTTIGTIDVAFAFGDIAWDATEQKLYMVDGRGAKALYTVDTTTAKATLVGTHGVVDVFALSFDGTHRLFAARNSSGNGFELVNEASGAMTAVGSGGLATDGLAFDSKRSLMMAMITANSQLGTVDLTTGVATAVGKAGPNLNDLGLTYDPFTDKLIVADENSTLVQFDPANDYAEQQLTTLPGVIDGIAVFVPPASP